MAKNKITDLRDHLFATLEALRDDTKPMEIDRAKAVADVARVIVETAKVEVSMMEATGEVSGTGFIDMPATRRIGPAPVTKVS
ncbi:MAG: hypothetical protein AB7I50_00715 [Vicinamibacterales bacterium]